MYFWRVDLLVDDFIHNRISEEQKFKYILLYMALQSMAGSQIFNTGITYTNKLIFEAVLGVVVTIVGTVWCFRQNQSGDGRDFVARYVCLGFPIVVRMCAFLTPVLVALSFLPSVEKGSFPGQAYLESIVVNIGMAGYYFYVGKSIEKVASEIQVSKDVATTFD